MEQELSLQNDDLSNLIFLVVFWIVRYGVYVINFSYMDVSQTLQTHFGPFNAKSLDRE